MQLKTPAIQRSEALPELMQGQRPDLPQEVIDLAGVISKEFQRLPDGTRREADCLVDGYDKDYLAAEPGWKDHPDRFSVFPVTVSEDIAMHHYCMEKNIPPLFASMGFYLVPVITLFDWPEIVIHKRPDSAIVYPGKFNGLGTALTPGMGTGYLDSFLEVYARKYNVQPDKEKLRPLGIIEDCSTGYCLLSAWLAVRGFPENPSLEKVGIDDLPEFIEEHGFEDWNYPGMLAVCRAAEGFGREYEEQMGRRVGNALKKEYERLQASPITTGSVWASIRSEASG